MWRLYLREEIELNKKLNNTQVADKKNMQFNQMTTIFLCGAPWVKLFCFSQVSKTYFITYKYFATRRYNDTELSLLQHLQDRM